MSFFSSLRAALSKDPKANQELRGLARPPSSPEPPEPIDWPTADASLLPADDVVAEPQAPWLEPAIAEEIQEEVQQAKLLREKEDTGIRLQRGGMSSSRPYDPLFNDVFDNCKPRAFTDRIRQGVRDVYGGNAVPFYRAAGITRSAYSRLVSHPERHPSKDTALSMAAALKLDEKGVEEFLGLAGYALSPSYPEDAVWRICFRRGIHDLATIRSLLRQI